MLTTNARRGRRLAGWTGLVCAALLATACNGNGSVAAGPATGPATAPATVPATGPTANSTFLAEGQDINGTVLHMPLCTSGCALSGDSTSILAKMTWNTWSASEAVGTGTYELDGCDPDCAAGPVYKVPAVVTLSKPVKVCSSSGTRWVWSRASFRFPHGLPRALRGSNAPLNPWVFSSVRSAARHSCAG